MFINATGFYVPEERVDNQHFLELNGLTSEWIEQRTGIRSRSKAKAEENINTMSMEAVRNALPKLPYDITDVDLIVSASYSPYDTVATAAHLAQHEFHIENAKALYLSSACSSFLNALEVVEGYFAMGKATKALILSADKNSAYYNETDPKAGHLWGDAAAAFFISKERVSEKGFRDRGSIHTRTWLSGQGSGCGSSSSVRRGNHDAGRTRRLYPSLYLYAEERALSLGKEWLYVGQPDIFHRPSSQYAYHVQYCQTAQSAGREIPA